MLLKEIAQHLSGKVIGDGNVTILGASGIQEAGPGEITFLANEKYSSLAKKTKASAIILSNPLKNLALPQVCVDNPNAAFSAVVQLMGPKPPEIEKGIHPTAVIGRGVRLGEEVTLQAYTVIQNGAEIGDRTVLYSGVYIGHETKVGSDCMLYPGVVVRERCSIGDRVIIHSNTVIGCDGFGYATVEGCHQKIPQIGTVTIEDDVEVGSNVTIDRARFKTTLIGKGTKVDNLVHIAHNVEVGANSIIVAQVGIAGSTKIGQNVIVAGQAGIDGHVVIGDNVKVAGKAGVTRDVPPGSVVWGFPARTRTQQLRERACIAKLPEAFKMLKNLKERLDRIEEDAENHKKSG